jgi:O-antigen/teichoic acid export membrane protein
VSVEEQQLAEERLGVRAASGVLWLAAQKWVVRASGIVTLAVLARRVSPQEFGVVAAAMTVIPLVYLLSDLGFSTYLLQARDTGRTTLSTAFWTSVAAGLTLSLALLAAAPLLAAAFRIPQLAPVLRALILAVIPMVLAGVPLALMRRALAFRAVAVQGVVAAMAAQVVAVGIALAGGGVWALVGQLIVTQWVIAVLAWRSAAWRPSFELSPALFREMAAFGLRVSSVDVVATMRSLAEGWLVAVVLGPSALGLLNIAQRLIQVAQELTASSLVPVSTVVFAKVRESPERLRPSYLKALGVAYAVVSPVMVLLVVTAPVSIPLLFGSQWGGSVLPAQALAIAGIVTLGAMIDHGLFYGLGRPGSWLRYSVVVDGATVATTAVAVRWGLSGVAVGFVAVAVAATVARWVLVGRILGLTIATMARPLLMVTVPTLATVAAGTVLLDALSGANPLVTLALAGAGTLTTDLVLLRLFSGRVVRDALSVLPLPERHMRRVVGLLKFEPARST